MTGRLSPLARSRRSRKNHRDPKSRKSQIDRENQRPRRKCQRQAMLQTQQAIFCFLQGRQQVLLSAPECSEKEEKQTGNPCAGGSMPPAHLKIFPNHLKRFLFTSVKNSCRMRIDFGNTRKSFMYAKRFENCKNGMILAINQSINHSINQSINQSINRL